MPSTLGVSESQLLEFAKSIQLEASKALEGLHASRRGGEGLEFHSSNQYTEGDDARFIDWRRFAATDKYFIKKFERQEKISWTVLIDNSPSMRFGEKARFVAQFAGCFAFIAQALGDQWKLVPSVQSSLEDAFQDLLHSRVGMDLSTTEIRDVSLSRSDHLIILSDLFFDSTTLENWLQENAETYRNLTMVQILDPMEKNFGFSGVLEFEDLESPSKLVLDSKSVRAAYLRSLSRLQDDWRRRLRDKGRFLEMAALQEQMSVQLRRLFEI